MLKPKRSSSNPKIFTTLQSTRAIAALMVVVFHASDILRLPKYWGNPDWKRGLDFGKSGVELFFVLSGIVIMHAHAQDIGRPARLGQYIWKRFRRIYPIYWIVLGLVIPIYAFFPQYGSGTERSLSVVVSSILLFHICSPATILAVSWTLFHEVMFYAAFSLLILSRKTGVVVFCAWLTMSAFALLFPPTNALLGEAVSPLHLLFGLGVGVGSLSTHRNLPAPQISITIGMAIIVAACAGDVVRWSIFTVEEGMLGNLILGCGAALALWGLMQAERDALVKVPKSLLVTGDASYSIYLVHLPVMSVTAKIVYRAWHGHPGPLLYPFLVLVAVGTFFGLATHFWVERPLLRLMSARTGVTQVLVTNQSKSVLMT